MPGPLKGGENLEILVHPPTEFEPHAIYHFRGKNKQTNENKNKDKKQIKTKQKKQNKTKQNKPKQNKNNKQKQTKNKTEQKTTTTTTKTHAVNSYHKNSPKITS